MRENRLSFPDIAGKIGNSYHWNLIAMRTSSGEGINWTWLILVTEFFMATHMENYRKMGEIIRHLERKLGKIWGIKEKNNRLNVEHNLQRPSHDTSEVFS